MNSSSYSEWIKKGSSSAAVYNARTAGEKSSGDIRISAGTSPKSGIVSTQSGGVLKKVVFKWNSAKATSTSKTVKVYGSNTPYASHSDAYDAEKQGTLLGSCSYKKDDETSEFTIEVPEGQAYTYVAIASASSVCYFDSIKITWE